MKTILLSLLLIGALPLPARATDVATRPLNASVLVRPNVVIAMDDSGSMDAEILFSGTSSGFLWWNRDTRKAWENGRLLDNVPGVSARLSYLFPNGVDASAGKLLYPWRSLGAVPPSKEFAFLRASAYNPLYYDPALTYLPWRPYFQDGALHSFADADATAARSHPVIGSAPFDLTRAHCDAGDDERFAIWEGMTIDAGTKWGLVDCASTQPAEFVVGGEQPAPAFGGVWGDLSLAIQYYPATYWVPQACTVGASVSDCARAPDGRTLKRYEIRPGTTYPSGRPYATEMQNFANWFQYYRKRKLTMAASMGTVLESLRDVNVGVVPFSSNVSPTFYSNESADAARTLRTAAAPFYLSNKAVGTPTRTTLKFIGNEFATNTGLITQACQRNSVLIATDGHPDDLATSPPPYNAALYGTGSPYATLQAGSLADLALAYYTINPRPSFATGKLAPSTGDPNPNLHVTTYAVTLGSIGNLWPATAVPAASPNPYPWPDSTFGPAATNPNAIDELWHATINGRGQMYLATTPAATTSALQSAFDELQSQTGVQAVTGVGSVNLARGDGQAYVSSYNLKGWTGDLAAHAISASTGEVATATLWSAATLLAERDWRQRVIATHDGTTGRAFTATEVAALVNPGQAHGDDGPLFDYLRGRRDLEGSSFRARGSLLAAIVNSAPVVSTDDAVVYQASNEGMLHAFSTRTGRELWAYVPYQQLGAIAATSDAHYRFTTQLDGTPVLATVTGRKLLLGGRGSGGAGWYALDVTDPASLTSDAAVAGRALWEFPNAQTSAAVRKTLGLSVGVPRIVKLKGSGISVALLSSGYNNAAQDGKGRLFVLSATSGTLLQTLVADSGTTGTDPGFAQFSPYHEDDGTVQYVYGGDELGNLWRFDLVSQAVERLAMLKDASGNAQPVTTAPALVSYQGQRIVFVGTGRLLGLADLSATPGTQSVYAIADGSSLGNARGKLVKQAYDAGTDTVAANAVDWLNGRGWYLDLPPGEVVNTAPSLGYNALVLVTNKSAIADCSASSRYYALDMRRGASIPALGYVSALLSDTDLSSRMTLLRTGGPSGGSVASTSASSTRTACGSGGIAGLSTTASGKTQTTSLNLCQALPARKNAWTEIRR